MSLMNSRLWHILRICVCLCLLLLFLAFPAQAEPETTGGGEESAKTEAVDSDDAVATGWVEVKASVPEGFEHSLILTIVNTETYAEIDFRILSDNDYIDRRQIPYGTYSVKQAFAPNDIRYAGIPAEDTFTLTGEEKAAVLISLTVDMMEQYKKEEQAVTPEVSVDTESGSDDQTNEVPSEVIVGEEEPEMKDSGDDAVAENNDAGNKKQDQSEQKEDETDSGRSFFELLVIALFGTAVFVLVIIAIAYLVRRRYRD